MGLVVFDRFFCYIYFFFFYIVHILPDPVNCPKGCGRLYSGAKRKSNLKRHLDKECGIPRKYQCLKCGKLFTRNNHLKTHNILVHKLII